MEKRPNVDIHLHIPLSLFNRASQIAGTTSFSATIRKALEEYCERHATECPAALEVPGEQTVLAHFSRVWGPPKESC